MKVLITMHDCETNHVIKTLSNLQNWHIVTVLNDAALLEKCCTEFYDVIVINSTLSNINWRNDIVAIRNKQIFTPILVIADVDDTTGLSEGADMTMLVPYTADELKLRIRVLKRRNQNYQSPLISYHGIELNRPDSKIRFEERTLSVSPIEIELFRLLTRSASPIAISSLADKINESNEKVIFFAKCLQTKIALLNSPIHLNIKHGKCQLIVKG